MMMMWRLLAIGLVPLATACGSGGAISQAQATAAALVTAGAGTVQATAPTVQAVAPTAQAAAKSAAGDANAVATSVAATVQAVLPTAQAALPTAQAAAKSASPVPSAAPVAKAGQPAASPAPVAKAASPSPSPSPRAAGGLKIVTAIGNDSQFGARMTGYIENQGREPFSQLQIKGTLLDEADQALESKTGIYMRDVVPVGERSPFLVPFSAEVKDWKKFDVEARAQAFDARSLGTSGLAQGLTLEGVELIPPENRFAGYKLTGTIKNGGTSPATNVVVIAALYDGDKEAIDVNQVSADPPTLAPGQSVRFEMDFPFTNVGVVDHELWAQGRAGR
jgi:hypothetical protein